MASPNWITAYAMPAMDFHILSRSAALGTKLTSTPTTNSAGLNDTIGFRAGDKVLLDTNDPNADPRPPCLLDQVTAVGVYSNNNLTFSNLFHSNNPLVTGFAVYSVVLSFGNQPLINLWGG